MHDRVGQLTEGLLLPMDVQFSPSLPSHRPNGGFVVMKAAVRVL